jgi:hypothetical protein
MRGDGAHRHAELDGAAGRRLDAARFRRPHLRLLHGWRPECPPPPRPAVSGHNRACFGRCGRR